MTEKQKSRFKIVTSNGKRDLACVALLFALTVVFFWRIVFDSREYTLLAQYDNAQQFYPWYQYAQRVIKQGGLPLWNPYAFSGHTFIGEMQAAVFYPLNLLMFRLPANRRGLLPPLVIEGFIILGHFLATVFMFVLARRLGASRFGSIVAGVCFGLNGFVATRSLGQINLFQAATWVPLIFWGFINSLESSEIRRRIIWAMLSGSFLGMSLLAGHPQPALYAALALGGYAIFYALTADKRGDVKSAMRRAMWPVVLALIALIVAMGFSAVQLLPTYEYAQRAIRWIGWELRPGARVPYQVLAEHAMAPIDFISFVFPAIYYNLDTHPYFGILPLLLAILALSSWRSNPYVRFFAILAAVAVVYALGPYSLLHGLSYMLPIMDAARTINRALFMTHFGLAAMAGFGADIILRPIKRSQRKWVRAFVRITNRMAFGLSLIVSLAYLVKMFVIKPEPSGAENQMLFSCLLLVAAASLLTARFRHLLSRRALKFSILTVILFDTVYFNTQGILPKSGFDGKSNLAPLEYYRSNDVIDLLKAEKGRFRVDIRDEALPPNIGLIYSLEGTFGYGATAYADYWDFIFSSYAPPGRPLDLLNVKYIVAKNEIPGWELVHGGEIKVYRNPHPMPRAWIVHSVEVIPDFKAALARVNSSSFDPNAIAVSDRPVPGMDAQGLCENAHSFEIVGFAPNRIEFKVSADAPGVFIASEVYYPGWQAYVDGLKSEIYRVNGILRGVRVERGEHEVRFEYSPRSFRLGLWISICTLTTLIIAQAAVFLKR